MGAKHVLVAYGTKNGSTRDIASTIAGVLRERGLTAEVRPAQDVRSVEGYDAVVLGGALYMNRWHRAAARFARRQAGTLAGRPVWLFSSGPLDASAGERDIPPVAGAARAADRLAARGHKTFGGRLAEGANGLIARQLLKQGRGGDFRDPARIRAWAHEIAEQLKAGKPGADSATNGATGAHL